MPFLEAVYANEVDAARWAERVLSAADDVFGQQPLQGILVTRHSADLARNEAVFHAGRVIVPNPTLPPHGLNAAIVRDIFYPAGLMMTQLSRIRKMAPEDAQVMYATLETYQIRDAFGIVVHPEPGMTFVMFSGRDHEIHVSKRERQVLTQLALHIEAGYRLRLRPESVKAVVKPDGTVLHREQDAPEADRLTAHAKHVDRARTRRNRSSMDAIDPWTALVNGSVSLVERIEGAQRFYLMIENAPNRQPLRALSRSEIEVVAQASRGLSSKLVSYALGVSPSTVSARLASAAEKVGLASRSELIRVAALLSRDPRAGFDDVALTLAERDVLKLVAQGLSNAEIATMRNRSVRTIANQVATLLRKTQSPTRRALVARR